MGSMCCHQDANSKYIDTKMRENEMYENSLKKFLILGSGHSGKSTVFKHLNLLYGSGFTDEDKITLKHYINGQIISQMQAAIRHYLNQATHDDTILQSAINTIQEYYTFDILTQEIAECILYVWKNDKRLKEIFNKFPAKKILDETTEYFWNAIERIAENDYVPTHQDILKIRHRTTGIIEMRLTVKNHNLHLFDVGGAKSERKKWMKCFDDIHAIVFVVSLSSYNEMMFED
eukprot:470747_1